MIPFGVSWANKDTPSISSHRSRSRSNYNMYYYREDSEIPGLNIVKVFFYPLLFPFVLTRKFANYFEKKK